MKTNLLKKQKAFLKLLLNTLFMLMAGLISLNAQVTPIPKSINDVLSTQITSVTVGGVAVQCVREADCELQYVHFMYNAPATVVITAANTIGNNSVHPVGRGITPTVSGNTMTLNISPDAIKATHLLVKIEGCDPLMILGDRPETDVPVVNGTNVVSITDDYGAANNYTVDVTSIIQQAINDMSNQGGGTVVFPAGTYKVYQTIFLKSNAHIYLAPGAHIESIPLGGQSYPLKPGSSTFAIPFMDLTGKNNVKIYGRGTLNANGTKIMNPDGINYRRHIITGDINGTVKSNNITVDGVILKNSTTWTCDIKYADVVNISNVKVLNKWNQNNVKVQNDGINLCSSSNGHVWNNFVMTGDDAFCVKAQDEADGGTRNCYNIQNHDNVIFNMGAANKIGMNAKAEIFDVDFNRNESIGSRRGVVVEALESGSNDVYRPMHDITFSDITIEHYQGYTGLTQRIIEFWAYKANIYNITVNNLVSLEVPISGGDIYCGTGTSINSVTFNCLKIAGQQITQENYAANGLDITSCASNITFNSCLNIPVESVSVSPLTLNLDEGNTGQLSATVAPANATNKTVTWTSSNTAVATVNTNGLVTGVSAGSATITVATNDGGFTNNCAVTVSAPIPVNSLDIEAESASNQIDFSPFVVVDDATASGGKYIMNTLYTTSVIENNGGLANYFFILSGTATISFSVNANFPGGGDDSFFYRIDNGPWQVQNGPTTDGWQTIAITNFTDLSSANTHTLTILRREDGAKIDKITLSTTSNVIISEPSNIVNVTGINLSTTTLALEAGQTSQLTATVLPANATDKTVTWLSNNSAVATVDANGLVTAISAGSATITVKTNDGEFTATCTVTVPNIDNNLYEAELATYTNGIVKTGGTGLCVDLESDGKITWNINSSSNTTSNLTFSIASPSDNRSMGVYVNNVKKGVISTSLSTFSNKTVITNLNAGNNVIELRDSEGTRELDVDYVSVENIPTTKLTLSYNNVATSGWANPAYTVDGDVLTPASKSGSTAAYIEYNLSGTCMLTSARINEDNAGNWQLDSWKLQYYNGSTWVDAFAYTNSTTAGWNEVAINGVVTDKIRVYFLEDSYIEVFEVEVYGAVVTSKSAMIDAKQQNISVGSSTNVYPYLIKDKLNVVCNGNENIISVTLFDVSGKKLNGGNIDNSNLQTYTLNTAGLKNGIYFIQVVTKLEGVLKPQTFKVIK